MGNSFEGLSDKGKERVSDFIELALYWLNTNSNTSFFGTVKEDSPEPEIYNELAAKYWKLSINKADIVWPIYMLGLRTITIKF